MRATAAGASVGLALEEFDGRTARDGRVLCFLQPGEANASAAIARLAANNRALRQDNAALARRLDRLERAVQTLEAGLVVRSARRH